MCRHDGRGVIPSCFCGRRGSLYGEISGILDESEFHPVFQPIVALSTGDVLGYEALTRFEDGARPDRRFAEAGAVGLQADLEIACTLKAIRAVERTLPACRWLSINLSPATVLRGGASGIAAVSSIPLSMEITEHAQVENYARLRGALKRVPDARVLVDDAGAGYAGLNHILELQPDVVKLDISLVRSIDIDRTRQALFSGLQQFAAEAGFALLAEGVETEAEASALRGLGIEMAQGYFFGKPVEFP